MKVFAVAFLLLNLAAISSAQYPLTFNYSTYGNPYLTASKPYQNVVPVNLSPGGRAFESVYATDPISGAVSGGYLAVGANVDPPIVEWVGGPVEGFWPADLVNNVPFAQSIFGPNDYRMIGIQATAKGTKIAYYRGGWGPSFALDYLYTADDVANDHPLTLGAYPYADYAAVSLQDGARAELAVFYDNYAASAGPNPLVKFKDGDILPTSAVTCGNTFLVAGEDNLAAATTGGTRVCAYQINSNGTVSRTYTLTFSDTLLGGNFTYHAIHLGAYSSSFNVIADNRISINPSGQFAYSYVLSAYNGVGHLLWQSTPHPGDVTRLSVGSTTDIYVLVSGFPGQYLCQYNSTGVATGPALTEPCAAAAISNAGANGVVCGFNTVDNTGHKHPTVTVLDQNFKVLQSFNYETQATNNDTLSDLLWTTDGTYYYVYLEGQYVQPNGQDGVFGAMWDTWGAYYP